MEGEGGGGGGGGGGRKSIDAVVPIAEKAPMSHTPNNTFS